MAVSTPVNAEDKPSNWVSFSALVTAITLLPVVRRLPLTAHRLPLLFTAYRNGQRLTVNDSVLDRLHTGGIDPHPGPHRGRHRDALQIPAFRGGRLGLHDTVDERVRIL